MSFDSTPAYGTLIREFYNKGDRRLKRVALKIQSKMHPEEVLTGYALMTELNGEMLSFFSTRKFLIDEHILIHMKLGDDELDFQLQMSHLHEQISSGRIMTSIPTEEHPFPARKFYRCFAKVLELKRNGVSVNGEITSESDRKPDIAPIEPTVESPEDSESEQKVA